MHEHNYETTPLYLYQCYNLKFCTTVNFIKSMTIQSLLNKHKCSNKLKAMRTNIFTTKTQAQHLEPGRKQTPVARKAATRNDVSTSTAAPAIVNNLSGSSVPQSVHVTFVNALQALLPPKTSSLL